MKITPATNELACYFTQQKIAHKDHNNDLLPLIKSCCLTQVRQFVQIWMCFSEYSELSHMQYKSHSEFF